MKKKLKYDFILICGILLAAAALYLLFRPGGSGAWVVVTVDGTETARYPLHEELTVTLGETDYNLLEISGGAACITDANCGDQTCVHTGAITREGETIVCLPHRLTVRVEGGQGLDIDAVAQ